MIPLPPRSTRTDTLFPYTTLFRSLFGLQFRAVDTAGLEERFDASLEARMRTQTEKALAEADLALLVFDARAGITPLDEHYARWLRSSGKAVALGANTCEGREAEAGLGSASISVERRVGKECGITCRPRW